MISRLAILTAPTPSAPTSIASKGNQHVITNAAGAIVRRSNTLAGLLRHLGEHVVASVVITSHRDKTGTLLVTFENGDVSVTSFLSATVLLGWVRGRRMLRGVPTTLVEWTAAPTGQYA